MAARSKRRKHTVAGSKKSLSSRSLQMTLTAAMAVASGVSTQISRAAVPIALSQVEHGSATIANAGSLATITAANRTIIDYSRFDIPVGDTVRFIQPSATSIVLNRINSATPSQIDGNLFANGIIYLVNPAGVMFGNNSVINVGQIFAAAGSLSNQDFLSGNNHFTNVNGEVTNAGSITATAVNFVGSMVGNSGEIVAPGGTVVMAAGNDVILGQIGGNLFVQIDNKDAPVSTASSSTAAVSNTGTISAKGGKVTMAAGDLLSLSIQNSGSIQASDVAVQGGDNSTVLISGNIDASNSNGSGGTVTVNGGSIGIGVVQNSDGTYADAPVAINASGSAGGGKILVGVKPDLTSKTGYSDAANYDYISSKATLTADATVKGNGGLVDTSGATLTVAPNATINAQGAGGGSAGEWLLDPVNINIAAAANSGNITTTVVGGTTTYSPNSTATDPAIVSATVITNTLQGGNNVIVQTTPYSNAIPTPPDVGTDAGNIVLLSGVSINPNIPAGDNVTLTLFAADNIDIVGNIASRGSGILNVDLNAAGNIYIGGVYANGTFTPGPGSVSTFSSNGVGGNISINSNADILISSTATWALNSAGSEGGGSIYIAALGGVTISPGTGGPAAGFPGVPGSGGIATGGGALAIEAISSSITIGGVELSTAGYGAGAAGGAMAIYTQLTANVALNGTTLNSTGALGGAGPATPGLISAGGGGAIAIFSGYGFDNEGVVTLSNVTFDTGGGAGGTAVAFPGGGSYFHFGDNLFGLSAGYLYLEGVTTINSEVLAGVTITATSGAAAGVDQGGGIKITHGFNPFFNDWAITGGGGGYTAAGAAAPNGGYIHFDYVGDETLTTPSGAGEAPTGVAAGLAGPAVFAAMNTFFVNAGTPQIPVAPSVTSDGGGQFYQNQWEIPPSSSSWVVGEIIVQNNTTIQDTGAVTATATPAGSAVPFTYSSYGVVVFGGNVDDPIGLATSSAGLTVTTASGDIAFDFPVGANAPLSSLTAWAGWDLTTTEVTDSALPWTTQPLASNLPFGVVGHPGPTVGQIQLGAGSVNLEPLGNDYMNNLEQIFTNSVGKTNNIGFNPAGGTSAASQYTSNRYYPSYSTLNPEPFANGNETITTSGSMLIQGALVDENTYEIGGSNIWPGSLTLISTNGDIYFDPYSYMQFYGIFAAAALGPGPVSLISSGLPTIEANGENASVGNPTTLSNNVVISVDGPIATGAILTSGTTISSGDEYYGTSYVSYYANSILPGSIVIPSNVINTILANPELVGPGSIAPIGSIDVEDVLENTVTLTIPVGFEALADNGGNIFIGGASPAPSIGNGPIPESAGGFTVDTDTAAIGILATNAQGNSGNIEIGSGAFLESDGGYIAVVSLASTGITEGNSGNIQFDSGARLGSLGAGSTFVGGTIVVASVDMASSSSNYHSGNITFMPSTTGVESDVNANNSSVYIGSVTFNGSSGNITLGYDVNIVGAGDVQIASNAGYGALTTGADAFQTFILNSINSTFELGLVVPMIANPAGSAGHIIIGAGDLIQSGNAQNLGNVVIGSYSGMGNSSYVTTEVDSKIISSSGYVKIESEALLNNQFILAGGTYSATPSTITINGGIIAENSTIGTPLRIASIGSGIAAGLYSVSFGDITISSASYTIPIPTIPPAVSQTISGAGYLDTSAPTAVAGNVTIAADVLMIDDEPLTVGGPIPIAINASGVQGGAVNLFGFTAVNLISGEITTQGGLPPVAGGLGVQGSGGAVAISSSGSITIGSLTGTGELVINASSAYNGGGGAVAIFSTAADEPVNLYRVNINTSGGEGLYDSNTGLNDIGGGGGGAVAVYNTSNITIANTTITTTGNGSGAIGINSSGGYIAFLGTNEFSTGVGASLNHNYGGGGGISGSLAGENLAVGGGGGGGGNGAVSNGVAGFGGGGITNGGYPTTVNTTINAIIVNGFVTLGPVPTAGYGGGITDGGGGYAPNGEFVGGSGTGNPYVNPPTNTIQAGGNYGGSQPGQAGALTFSAAQIQFGSPTDTSPVSLTTTGSGQYYNGPIVLYAPTTLSDTGAAGSGALDITFGPGSSINAGNSIGGLNVIDSNGNIIFKGLIGNVMPPAFLTATVNPDPAEIEIFTDGGYFTSITTGYQAFNGAVVVETTGAAASFTLTAGGYIKLTGSLTDSGSVPMTVSLTSSAPLAAGSYAITLGGSITSYGGNVTAQASSGGNIAMGSPAVSSTISTAGGNVLIKSNSTTGSSGSVTSLGTLSITSGGGYITIESIAGGGSSGNIMLNGVINSDGGGNVLVESNSSTGSSGNIAGEDAFSINSGSGTLTLESIAGGGSSGYISLVSTASPMLSSDDAKITILTKTTTAAASSGYITLGGGITSVGGNVLVETESTTGASGNITGEDAFSVQSGGGYVTIESIAGAGVAGEVSLSSNTSPMINSDGGYVTVESDSTVSGGGGVSIGGGIDSGATGGNILISAINGPVSIGAVTLNSSATGSAGGKITITSSGTGNVSLDGTTINSSGAVGDAGGALDVSAAGNLMLSGAIAINTSGSPSGAISFTSTGGYVSLPLAGSIGITFGSHSSATYDMTIAASRINILGSITLEPASTGSMTLDAAASAGTTTLGAINGAIALTATSPTGVNLSGPIGQTTALESVIATSSSGYVTVNAITATGNITLTPSTALFLGGAGYHDYRPQGLLTINGNLDSTGGSIALGGSATYMSNPAVPSVATIVGNFNGTVPGAQTSLTITAADDVTMGQDQKFTQFGSLNIAAGVKAQIGDINTVGNTGSLTVTAPSIVINLRPSGQLLTSLGLLDSALLPPPSVVDSTDFISSGRIDFSVSPTTSGSGPAPQFASSTAYGSASSVPGYVVMPYGLPRLPGSIGSGLEKLLASQHVVVAYVGSPIPNSLALYNTTPLDLNAADLSPELIALYNQLLQQATLISETNISTILISPSAPPGYPAVNPPQPGTGEKLSLQSAGLNVGLDSPTVDEIIEILSGNNTSGAIPPYSSNPQSISTRTLGNDSLNQLLSDYYALFCFQGGTPNWFQQPTWYEIVGQRRNIQKTLSLAYNIYLNSTDYDTTQETGFVDFLSSHRNSDPTLAQALTYIQQIRAVCDDMYQAGVTPGQFENVEDEFLGPLTPEGMSEDEFISIVAPQQLQLTMQ